MQRSYRVGHANPNKNRIVSRRRMSDGKRAAMLTATNNMYLALD